VNDFLIQLRERFLFIFAVAATTLWLVAIAGYLQAIGGLESLKNYVPMQLAALVAAAGGPLAALWLMVAVFEQRRAVSIFARRLADMSAQNRQSLQQVESQTRTLLQLQAQSARTQVLETRRLALQDMAASVAVLAERLGVMSRDAANAAWQRYGAGDVNVFVQSFLSFAGSHPDISDRMAEAVAEDQVAAAALAAFVRRYEKLLAATGDDKFATEIFDDGALGRAYRLFKNADVQAMRLSSPETAAAADLTESEGEIARRLASLSDRLETAAPQLAS
jgi:hypothetical protein